MGNGFVKALCACIAVALSMCIFSAMALATEAEVPAAEGEAIQAVEAEIDQPAASENIANGTAATEAPSETAAEEQTPAEPASEEHAAAPENPANPAATTPANEQTATGADEAEQAAQPSEPQTSSEAAASEPLVNAQSPKQTVPAAKADAVPVAAKPSLTKAKITTSKRKLYNGKRIKPKVKVVLHGKKLKLNRDFKVAYKNNKKVGKATIVVKGIGKYTGKVKKRFKIVSQLVVAVPDKSASSASGMIRYLRSMGIKGVYVHSSKINLNKYDGLAVPGGINDVDPRYYGEKNRHCVNPVPKTDKMQFKLIRKFAKANKPVIGICKGCQLINVAFGGSLYQDLGGYHRSYNMTTFKKGSRLAKALGTTKKSVYHYHHQAAKKLGKGLKAVAWSKKGSRRVIEAIEHKTLPVWGIQFHPEYQSGVDWRVMKAYKKEVIRHM